MPDTEEAVAVCYVVKLDDKNLGNLGAFSSCDGLGCEFVMEQREEGGNNGMVWQLPTRIKYSNIKLSRPVTEASSQITKWFASLASGIERKTATIEARTLEGKVIASWALEGVVPVRWSGPQLSPDSPKVATETLELAHHGFLSPAKKG
ncbi:MULTISPECIES: phage tail protein [Amycolatopsis]|jgi:phage tail-like protein|uniref:Phage tail protein n=1 Tax=Amycolatopsis vancoresmycina DSM 44592 TaxID=1292037 RepID=R1HPX3_9PSEU|nr:MULTISPECIES: phage tail protein [Amycolatopsis]MBE8516721.1 phage tail protein [Amycolatopsis sp. H6(2020)]EOD65560.1 phage tail protein [Amycolatopsis vancoresmycina DSM 44592]MDS0136892.1 phage tail protein [Amycolatopsis sp. 505]MDS0143557.1 phage tail protein [Amycolatopsis sp. CM201R]QKV72673.1 phage tail protein [Amycolatopsis sp. Hca4]